MKKSPLTVFISLIILLFALFATLGFSFIKKEIKLEPQSCDSFASQLYWLWLLDEIKLSSDNAGLHKVYAQDACAVFVDLNNDGDDEIVATHYNTSKVGRGQCLLFVLQKVADKYVKISSNIYFDPQFAIWVLKDKTEGYRNLEIKTLPRGESKTLVFDKGKNSYVVK